jgi:hypothetical protein
VLVYLSDVEEGGETVFPMLPPAQGQEAAGMSECAAQHLAVKPKKGTGEGKTEGCRLAQPCRFERDALGMQQQRQGRPQGWIKSCCASS